jgi:hypothetical protein
MAERTPMERCTDVRKSFGRGTLRQVRSAIIANTSKEFLFICQANKNQNGCGRLWLASMSRQELKIKPLTRSFFAFLAVGATALIVVSKDFHV